MINEARFLKRKFGDLNLGSMGLNLAQNEVFGYLHEFGSYVFLEIAYDDSLRQCLTSSRGKIHEKKIGPDIRFFAISLFSQVCFKFSFVQDDSLEQCLTLVL